MKMEACFFNSNSPPKTAKFGPLLKPRFLSNLSSSFQFPCRKSRFHSSPVTCCSLGSEDEERLSVNADDWRSFRARLVAGEKALRPQEPLLPATDPDTDSVEVKIGEKWAHKLHEPEKGCLLIASEKLDGVHIFERTVILLVTMGPVGPSGIILNRPSLMSIKEMKTRTMDVAGMFSERPLYFGGPLEEGVFLVKGEDGGGVFERVMKDLYYGSKESVGCAAEMVKRNVVRVEDFRFFDGYCGWEKEQLDYEIRAGYWTVAACSPSVIGLASDGLWDEVVGLMVPNKKVW